MHHTSGAEGSARAADRERESFALSAELKHQLVRPTAYRGNAFRVLGLPLAASEEDIARCVEAIARGSAKRPSGRLAASSRPLDAEAAQARLRDAELRLVDELYWFWPVTSVGGVWSPTAQRAASITADAELAVWEGAAQQGDASALHNLAVWHHALALEQHDGALTAQELVELEQHWRAALVHWDALCARDEFWPWLSARASALGLQNAVDRVAAIRGALPAVLARQLVQLCATAAFQDHAAAAECYRRLLARSEVERVHVQAALHDALGSRLDRLDALVADAEAEALRDLPRAMAVAHQLVQRARPLLGELDRALGVGHPWRDCAFDSVALAVKRCVVELPTQPPSRNMLELLGAAGTLANDPDLRDVLRGQLEELARRIDRDERARSGAQHAGLPAAPPAAARSVCVYCAQRRRAEESSSERWPVRRSDVQASVCVPRCAPCAQVHERDAQLLSGPGAAAGFGAGLFLQLMALGTPSMGQQGGWLGLADFLVRLLFDHGVAFAALGGALLAGRLARPEHDHAVKPQAAGADLPELRALAAEGWSIVVPRGSARWDRVLIPLAAVGCLAFAAARIVLVQPDAQRARRHRVEPSTAVAQAVVDAPAAEPDEQPVAEPLPHGLFAQVVSDLRERDARAARRSVAKISDDVPGNSQLAWLAAYLDALVAGDRADAERVARTDTPNLVPLDDPMRTVLAELAQTARVGRARTSRAAVDAFLKPGVKPAAPRAETGADPFAEPPTPPDRIELTPPAILDAP